MSGIIDDIVKGSIADDLEIRKKETLMSIDGKKVEDILDYQYLSAKKEIILRIEKLNREIIDYEIEKDENEDLGLVFNKAIFDKVKTCHNHCIFCFIDQNHPRSRKIVLCKDDDFRLSFLYGNFITLTNIKEDDFKKIFEYKLSPLYVSIHSTDDEIRNFMLSNKKSMRIKEYLDKFKVNRIKLHLQIVLCKDINDSFHLESTLKDLKEYYKNILSIGIVPLGKTKFRENLYKIESFDEKSAKETIEIVKKWQNYYKKEFKKNIIYLADEFYFLAKKILPSYEHYNEFYQYENGIGMARYFIYKFEKYLKKIGDFNVKKKSVVITSYLGYQVLSKVLNKIENVKIEMVKNSYFGESVTVTGLLSYEDISKKIDEIKNRYDRIIISDIVLNDHDKFIDDYKKEDFLKEYSDKEIVFVKNSAKALLKELIK